MGRFLIVELVVLIRTDLGRAVLSRADTAELEKFAIASRDGEPVDQGLPGGRGRADIGGRSPPGFRIR